MPKVVTKKPGLSTKLKTAGPVVRKRSGPVWSGPQDAGPKGGISQSMLWSFLGCRERFRLKYIDGLRPTDSFSKTLEYGNCWHVCEEALAAKRDWLPDLKVYCNQLLRRYSMHQDDINKWFKVCRVQFPIYVAYWAKQKDVVERTPLMQEQVFHVPYTLPSGRVVHLRGKFDAVDLIGRGKNAGVYLQENKTKGAVDEQKLARQLSFDLQTMLYLVALAGYQDQTKCLTEVTIHGDVEHSGNLTIIRNGTLTESNIPIRGVRYNVIRRPLSGGRGSIKQLEATQGAKCGKCNGVGKITKVPSVPGWADTVVCPKCNGDKRVGAKPAETAESYYGRLSGIIQSDVDNGEGSYWFMRHRIEISQSDIEAFKSQCLNPLLETVCDWYEWIEHNPDPFVEIGKTLTGNEMSNRFHWRHAFGGWNVLDEGGSHELDEFLKSGSELGLTRTDELFTELQ